VQLRKGQSSVNSRNNAVTIIRVGATKKYSEGWEAAFGKGKKKAVPAVATKKAAKKSTKKKASPKKGKKK
jgi:hypothetical protein